jgi:DNA-directed RNA polymerase specialized sigma24 family protein
LTPEQRQVITLGLLDGFDTAQVARLLDQPEDTVCTLQLRALQRLRHDLGGSAGGLAG